jgi:hypothetical protein
MLEKTIPNAKFVKLFTYLEQGKGHIIYDQSISI